MQVLLIRKARVQPFKSTKKVDSAEIFRKVNFYVYALCFNT